MYILFTHKGSLSPCRLTWYDYVDIGHFGGSDGEVGRVCGCPAITFDDIMSFDPHYAGSS